MVDNLSPRTILNSFSFLTISLRKHAHAIYRKFFGGKNRKFHNKNFDIFLNFAQKIDCGYTLEPPRRASSNEYPQSMIWSKNKKNIKIFVVKFSIFTTKKFSVYCMGLKGYILRGHVFLMSFSFFTILFYFFSFLFSFCLTICTSIKTVIPCLSMLRMLSVYIQDIHVTNMKTMIDYIFIS